MNYKLICSDIDGTLLNKDRELSERTIGIVKALKDIIPFVLISSRMPAAMKHLQIELDNSDQPLIAYNGGLVNSYSKGKEEELLSIEIPIVLADQILKITKGSSIHVSLYNRDEWFVPVMDKWAEREMNNTKVIPVVADLYEVCTKWKEENKGAHKIMCMGESGEIQILENYLMAHHADMLNVYRSKDTYLEIASKKISKLSALAFLLDHSYDISIEEVVAFGDNYNDLEMISGVGMGVAVSNARDIVKANANRITLGNKEDGVAIVLEDLFSNDVFNI